MPHAPSAAVCRLADRALDVLDEAYKGIADGSLERTALHRLALGYLLLTGCATKLHVIRIWQVLGHEGEYAQLSSQQSHFGNMTHGIRQNVAKLRS